MKSIFTLLSLIAALAVAVPTPATAAKKKTDDTSATDDSKGEPKKKDTYPFYGEVLSVTDSLLTIKGAKANRLFTITKDTKIHHGKDAATIKDVKVGAWVGGLVKKAPEGTKENPTLVSLNTDVKQKEDKKEAATDKAAPSKPDTTKTDAAKTDSKTDDKTTTKKTKKKKAADSTDSTTTPKTNQ